MDKNEKPRLLLVEDDADQRHFWLAALADVCSVVRMAGNGLEALAIVSHVQPDIVVSDVLLPEMDGFQLCHAIKKNPETQNIPVILYTTNYNNARDRQLATAYGASCMLQKPVPVERMIAAIEEAQMASETASFIHRVNSPEHEGVISKLHLDVVVQKLGITIAELQRQKKLLEHSLKRFQDFASIASELFFETDAEMRLIYLSTSGGEKCRRLPAQYQGLSFASYFGSCMDGDSIDAVSDLMTHHRDFQTDLHWRSVLNREERFYNINGKAIYDEAGLFTGYRGVFSDITEYQRRTDELQYEATHDMLTGLPNKRALESRLSQLLNESSSDHVICFIDLDYFKTVNDTAGHRAGDELLVQLSQYLQSHVRKTDLLSRVGGDEFIVLLEQCNLEQAERLVTLLHHAINRFRFQWKNQVFRVGASIGLNLIEQDCRLSIQEIISEADSACYQAKNGGGNRIEVHVREYHDHSGNLSGADNREHLEHALAENHFRLFSQPIVHANGKSHGCEVLVRLQDGDRLRGASEFMPSLMHYEMLSRLDGWVIHTTMDWMQRHPALVSGYEFVSLNLSAQSLRDKTFIHALFQRLEEQPDIAAKLCFEVSESDAIASIEAAVPFFQKARNLGSRFALDNFGKGFSSLAYLRNLPISFIKIDGFFVTGIADDPVNKDMLSSIQQLASIFKIRTIAKCVENAEIANQAREAGVDYLQGHFSGEIEPFVTSSDFYDNVTGLMAG